MYTVTSVHPVLELTAWHWGLRDILPAALATRRTALLDEDDLGVGVRGSTPRWAAFAVRRRVEVQLVEAET
jgi:hypothetical protein